MARRKINNIPSYDELIIPTLKALKLLGSSGTIEEINEKASQIAKISDKILQIPHGENGLQSEIDYRLAWSRTYLKKYGLIENSSRGVCVLSDAEIDINAVDKDKIIKTIREQSRLKCKRYKGSISSSLIRDFRGAMQGRADKGIFITTGNYTRDAIKEATRDGAPPIDLIDGELLCEKLKELGLGVETQIIEQVEIKKDWFSKL